MREAIANGDKAQIEFWDKRQLVKKINLNSLYGAIQPAVDFLTHVLVTLHLVDNYKTHGCNQPNNDW